MDRVRRRVGDKRVLALVKAFLKAGILGEDGALRDNDTGTPQGGILSPLLANIALSVLDEQIARHPGGPDTTRVQRARRRRNGQVNCRLVRYADDFLIVVSGTRAQAESLRDQAAAVLATMGLRLSPEKTMITHIDEGFDFLGWHIQRHRKRGTNQRYVYTYPARKAVKALMARIKTLCRQVNTNHGLDLLLRRLNSAMRGWGAYFRPGVSSATFQYVSHYAWERVIGWLRRKHRRTNWKDLRRRYCGGEWWPSGEEITLFDLGKVTTTRYRYRGVAGIPSPWPTA
jgi:RNA-directed DNA polymerase